ncbi:MAG: ABC transporter substrate-binding protein [Bacteroidota bacterium]
MKSISAGLLTSNETLQNNNFAISKSAFSSLLFIFGIAFLMLFTACDSLKKVPQPDKPKEENEELEEIQGKRVFNPETGTYEVVTDVTGDLDTIQWIPAGEEVAPPITSEATGRAEENTTFLDNYKMVLALPFLADKYNAAEDRIDRRSIPALNFYEGAKMALDVLSGEGANLEISVLDTRASQGTVMQLTNNFDLETANLVIGTFRNSTARAMAEFAKRREIPFVSPYFPHQNLVTDNEFFIQINPSERTHAEAIMKHAKERFRPNQIVIFGRNDPQEREIMQFYSDAHFAIEGGTFADSIRMVYLDDDVAALDQLKFDEYMDEINTTAFIIASSSQSFVYAMLRNIDLEKEDRSVVVYGQPRWKDFTQISYELYETMNVHISSEYYLNPNDVAIQTFKENFYNKYGMPPTVEAFKGYDTALYFGRLMQEYGTGFRYKLDQSPKNALHTQFDIQRTVTRPRSVEGEALDRFDQFMNKHLNILEFSGYQFRKAD